MLGASLRTTLFTVPTLLVAMAGVAVATEPDDGWPKRIGLKEGEIVIYQPQPDTLKNDLLTGRAAFSFQAANAAEPTFGVFWFDARFQVDRDNRVGAVRSAKVTEVRFPDATEEQKESFGRIVANAVPAADIRLSLDRLAASLETAKVEQEVAEGLATDAPPFVIEKEPAVLLFVDGKPEFRAVGDSGVDRLVNTPMLVMREKGKTELFLGSEFGWYRSQDVAGPWQPGAKPPRAITSQVPKDAPEIPKEPSKSPKIVTVTKPTELIAFTGEPEMAPLGDGSLLYAANTDRDVFVEVETKRWFILAAGRWYAASSLEGPWDFIRPDSLPDPFFSIPEGSPKASVRAHVAGTPEATDAYYDAQIPQTAAVRRGRADLDIEYDGDPKFEAIPGTEIRYAVNTGGTVLEVQGRYYACEQGVWYVAPSPKGPWDVSDHRPEGLEKVPPSSPVYNTKYVYVYDTTPSVVYVGYLPGYVGCYPWYGSVVWGTGWYYRPWISPYHYYPRPVTYGFSVHYNSYSGWSFGFGISSGFFSVSLWSSPSYRGPSYRYPGWYGPGGYRPPVVVPPRPPGYPRPRPTPYNAPASNIYARPSNQDRVARPSTQPSGQGRPAPAVADRANNVYSDRDGNVYRRNENGSWEQRDKGGWKPAQQPAERPAAKPTPQPSPTPAPRPTPQPSLPPSTRPTPQPSLPPSTRPTPQPSQPPSIRPTPQPRPSMPQARPSGPSGLERDYGARSRGNSRAQGAPSQARPAPRPAPGGGGGRRR